MCFSYGIAFFTWLLINVTSLYRPCNATTTSPFLLIIHTYRQPCLFLSTLSSTQRPHNTNKTSLYDDKIVKRHRHTYIHMRIHMKIDINVHVHLHWHSGVHAHPMSSVPVCLRVWLIAVLLLAPIESVKRRWRSTPWSVRRAVRHINATVTQPQTP